MPIHLCLVSSVSRLVAEYPVLIYTSIALLLGFVGLLLAALIHNAYLLRIERNRTSYEDSVQDYLTELVASTFDNQTLRLETNVSLNSLPELKKELLFNPIARGILRQEIKTLHKSLEGLAAKQLRTTYLSLGFLEECIEQLRSGDFKAKAEAITEFAEMEIYTVAEELQPYLLSNYPELRILAQTFHAKISETPLVFLQDYPFSISKWDQIELVNVLRKRKMDKFPGLRPLFKSSNETVRSFALLLTTNLQLTSYYSALIPALEDENLGVRLQAINEIKKWHHPVALNALRALESGDKSDQELKLINKSIKHLELKISGRDPSTLVLKNGLKL